MSHPQPDTGGLSPGAVIGRYEVVRLLGRGGMGSVYEGLHRDLKKRVAIKALLPSLAADPDARARFLREGEAASRIRHPHIVDVTDVGTEGAVIYLVMELLAGEDLRRRIQRAGQLSAAQTADILLPVCGAIAVAHDQGVIHRDLKPENLFLCTPTYAGHAEVPKVLDFGISKLADDPAKAALTGTGMLLGTMYYVAPEQLRGKPAATPKSDQYALGAIAYECVTGRRAFDGDEGNLYAILKAVGEGAFTRRRQHRPDLPADFEELILRAMQVDPSARFPSVRHLGLALLPFASPAIRAAWAPFFETALVDNGAARTQVLAQSSAEAAAKTTALPTGETAPARASTTFRGAAGETIAPDRRPVRWALVAGAVVLLAAVGLWTMRGSPRPVVAPTGAEPPVRSPSAAPRERPAVAPVTAPEAVEPPADEPAVPAPPTTASPPQKPAPAKKPVKPPKREKRPPKAFPQPNNAPLVD